MKKSLAAAILACAALAPSASHAAGTFTATGSIDGGACAGGPVWLDANNTDNNNWVFDVTVGCVGALPQHVVVAGSWNRALGGAVTGFGTGSLLVGKVACGGAANVSLSVSMVASPVLNGHFSTVFSSGCL